jgi:hypothetical protein
MTLSLIYGEAFEADPAAMGTDSIRVYRSRGKTFIGHSTHDIGHCCDECLGQAIPNEYLPSDNDPRAYVSIHEEHRPPRGLHRGLTVVRTCDVVAFDPGDDPYIVCEVCGEELYRDDEAYEAMFGHPL